MKNLRMLAVVLLAIAVATGACAVAGVGQPSNPTPTDEPTSTPTEQPDTPEPTQEPAGGAEEGPTQEPVEETEPNELVGTSWELAEINGDVPVPGTTFTLTFQEAELGGTACNTYSGTYTVDWWLIEVGEIVSTMMTCIEPEGIMEQETAYFDALSEVTRYDLSYNELGLGTEANRYALVFTLLGMQTYQTDMQTYQDLVYWFEVGYPDGAGPPQVSDEGSVRINLPFEADTNLQEKYLQIDANQDGGMCTTPLTKEQLPDTLDTEIVTIGDFDWTKQSFAYIGEENIYDFVVYSDTEGDTCVVLTFLLHSTNAQNYTPPLEEFDREAESAVFEEIVATFYWH